MFCFPNEVGIPYAAGAALCGLYRIEDGIPYFVVLTKDAVGDLLEIHDRMPLILPREKIDEWIDPGKVPEDVIPECVNRIEMRV